MHAVKKHGIYVMSLFTFFGLVMCWVSAKGVLTVVDLDRMPLALTKSGAVLRPACSHCRISTSRPYVATLQQ